MFKMLLAVSHFFPLVFLHWITQAHVVAGAHIPHPRRHDIRAAAASGTNAAYKFNADASDNVAVYFGQTDATGKTSLASLCQDPTVDIVILAFVTVAFGPGNYPKLNFGAACDGQTPKMQAYAPGLLSCPILASQIETCQSIGKKVFLSLGGWVAQTTFNSDADATRLAGTLWSLFGAGTDIDPALRPFGSVKIDGFDIDNEDHKTGQYAGSASAHYDTFATALRTQYAKDPSKTYYISAAPQCPRPDTSIPPGALQNADFVWVQFYNNPACDLGSPGFDASFAAWSADLVAAGAGKGGPGPKVLIGAPSFQNGGTGYVDSQRLATLVQRTKGSGTSNFGGVMLWDGAEGRFNVDRNGKSYMQAAKAALTGSYT